MPAVETTIRISVPEGGMTLGELEAAVAQAAEEAGQRLLVAAYREMEAARAGQSRLSCSLRPPDDDGNNASMKLR